MSTVMTERVLPLALTLSIDLFAVSSMLMVGLRYSIGDLARPLRDVKGVAIALGTNFLLVPLLAALLLRLLRLDKPYATGMIAVASAGGAPLLVKLAMNAKADVAFAASLIVLLLAGTMVAMPIIMSLLAAGTSVGAWAIARPLLLTMLLPLAAGFILKALLPRLAERAVPVLGKILSITLWALVVLSLFLNRSALVSVFGQGAIVASLLFTGLAFVLGYLTGGADQSEKVVLAFGASQRNFAAAIVVARQVFDDPRVLVMTVVVSIVSMLLIPLSLFLGRRKDRSRGGAPPVFRSRTRRAPV